MKDRCFSPVRSFRATINGSNNHYIQGMTYTIREGDEELRLTANDWACDNKIAYVRARRRPTGRISGSIRTNSR